MPPRIPSIKLSRDFLIPRYLRRAFSSSSPTGQSKVPNDAGSPIRLPAKEVSFAAYKPILSMVNAQKQRQNATRRTTLEAIAQYGQSADLERMMTRKWKLGDVYAPHDLSPVEMRKWRIRVKPSRDPFDVLAINPIHEYKVTYSPPFETSWLLHRMTVLQLLWAQAD
ncbi:hypothetical protein FGG08_005281 [Glutinoglossum americanum]|uniref:Uncharacterized protein n=1 Tax=Glutinoglossum americanum TaxID=1670608 RepID=A0A9P8I7K2_9PEZI|nr:hypothetical protein FGG08_005281 [Glutinoglossum americanum]